MRSGFQRLNILLCGPPGCGMTFKAHVAVAAASMPFIYVGGAEFVKECNHALVKVVRRFLLSILIHILILDYRQVECVFKFIDCYLFISGPCFIFQGDWLSTFHSFFFYDLDSFAIQGDLPQLLTTFLNHLAIVY